MDDIFNRQTINFLKTQNFTPTGYYSYDYVTHITGFFKLEHPFSSKISSIVFILNTGLSDTILDGLISLSQAYLAKRIIIISKGDTDTLSKDVIFSLEKNNIDYISKKQIKEYIKESDTELKDIKYIYEKLSPQYIASKLDMISKQIVPIEFEKYLGKDYPAWRLFEDIVFSIFQYGFTYNTKKLGRDTLFEREPEGKIIVPTPDSYGILYECKSAKNNYTMSSDHELRYIGYIKSKLNEFQFIDNAPLQYLLIIAPDFSGNLDARRDSIYRETGIMVIFMRASTLSKIAETIFILPNNIKKLINVKDLFSLSEAIVSEKNVTQWLAKISEYKRRW